MIDTHAHLGDDAPEVLARARAAGVTRVIDVATTITAARATLVRADEEDGVYACLGVHPHEAAEPGDLDELRELLAHPRAVAVGETGLDYYRDYAPHEAQAQLFDRQLALAREVGKPVVIHTRAADEDTEARLLQHDGAVVLHCFSSPKLLDSALERDWYISFAGNVTYKNAYDLRAAARRVPADRLLAETDSPYLAPQPVRGKRNEPAYVAHTYALSGGTARRGDPRADRRERRGGLRAVKVTPKKSLGQHFLVDENILGVIERLAELGHDDVVLEIGPGLGVLTRFLADRVAHVHAVELDRRLAPHLAGIERTTVHWGDAMRLDISRLDPPPSKLVANLPYNVATPLVAESLQVEQITSWCVMVQREVADRFFAQPVDQGVRQRVRARPARDRANRLPSRSRARSSGRGRTSSRPSSRSAASRPARRCRSSASSRARSAHRRKTLANSLSLSGLVTSERAVEALAAIGRDASVRAEALTPPEFVALAEALT